MTINLKVL